MESDTRGQRIVHDQFYQSRTVQFGKGGFAFLITALAALLLHRWGVGQAEADSRTPDIRSLEMSAFFSGWLSDREVQTQSRARKQGLGLIELITERGDSSGSMR